jgi:hypothetical protein
MNKPISQFFREDLHAPFQNDMWSWGAVDSQGRVFLRVWQKDLDWTAKTVLIVDDGWKASLLGYQERVQHIGLLENRAAGFMVICDGGRDSAGRQFTMPPRYDKVYRISHLERRADAVYAHFDGLVKVETL